MGSKLSTSKPATIKGKVKDKMDRLGYTVFAVKPERLPSSISWGDRNRETWYRLYISGMPITNNTCEHNLWSSNELTLFAAKLPEVTQLAFA